MSGENDNTTSTPGDAASSDAAAEAPPAEGGVRQDNEEITTLTDAAPLSAEELIAPFREERDRLKDQLLRIAADYDNFRKRTRKDLEEAERRGREDTVRELLPVFDNLERAIAAASQATDVASIVEGLKMVLRLFEDHIGRIGVRRVPSVGERFDPAIHDAIQQQDTDAHPPGTVIAEIAAGYLLGERLVRPAAVIVARKPAASA